MTDENHITKLLSTKNSISDKLTILSEKLFYSIQHKYAWLAASDLFCMCLHNQVPL